MTKPPELDAATKARIEAEEAYRAQVRANQATQVAPPPVPPKKKGATPLQIGCGGFSVLFLLMIMIASMSNSSQGGSSSQPEPTQEPVTMSNVTFARLCTEAISPHLKAPSTAKFQDEFDAQQAGDLTGTYESGFQWLGYVDAENSFGGHIRTKFVCESKPKGLEVTAKFLDN